MRFSKLFFVIATLIACQGNSINVPSAVAIIDNLRTVSAACDKKMSITPKEDGSMLINFQDVGVRRGDEKPFVRCRIVGEMTVPAGFKLAPNLQLLATVVGIFDQANDQAGGKLSINIASRRDSDFQMVVSDKPLERSINLTANIPEIEVCNEQILSVNILLEAMINYRLDRSSNIVANITDLVVPPIELVANECAPTDGILLRTATREKL